MVVRAPRRLSGRLAQARQKGCAAGDRDAGAGNRGRALLWLDRRAGRRTRRALLPAAFYAPAAAEQVVADQLPARDRTDRQRADATARPRGGREGAGGRSLGGRV